MTATWQGLNTWNTGEALTANDMNTYIRDNLDALKSPPTDHYELNEASDYTTTSTTFVDVDSTNLALTITPSGDTVMVGFSGAVRNSTDGASVYLDLEINGTRVGGDDGIFLATSGGANYAENASFIYLITGLTPSTAYTIKLQWKVSGTTAVDIHPQFWVREVS